MMHPLLLSSACLRWRSPALLRLSRAREQLQARGRCARGHLALPVRPGTSLAAFSSLRAPWSFDLSSAHLLRTASPRQQRPGPAALVAKNGGARRWLSLFRASSPLLSVTAPHPSSSAPPLADPVPQLDVSSWLFLVSSLVFAMVALGGLTRLTKSGLSMTEWKPASGIPPLTSAQWEAEFTKYKQFPEYRERGGDMSLREFQFIYGMEFAHRELGRLIGVVFVGGLLYYAAKGRISGKLVQRLSLLAVAGGMQGAVGWWMVKSGLEQPHRTPGGVHVSPYRLATHLLSAFVIYAILLSTALHLRFPRTSALVSLYQSSRPLQRLRSHALGTTALIALTIASGAFVAGNEAGLVYNEFPFMGNGLIPSDLTSPYITPLYRNAFEHSTLVQFEHRVLAITSLLSVTALYLAARRLPLTDGMRWMGRAVLGMAWVQVGLGVSTLVLYVPVPLASLHQCGSLMLLTLMIGFVHSLGGKRVTSITKALQAARPLQQQFKPITA